TGLYSVEKQLYIAGGLELLVGARWDPRFGAILVVGAGGVNAEILDDTASALAPIDVADAEALLLRLKCAPLLTGARRREPLAAESIGAFSRFAAGHRELAELEVNPLLVRPNSVDGLDARFVRAES